MAWSQLFSILLLVLTLANSSAFFVSFWGRNTPGLGAKNVGLALAFSFALPLTIYASLALALVALLSIIASARRLAFLRLVAFVVALLPLSFLLLVDVL